MAQRDPLQEFKMEGFDMFEEMTRSIQEDAVRFAFNIAINIQPREHKITNESTDGTRPQKVKKASQQATSQKVGRNDPCPCGSGKKYKQCCGK
ncbi:MAG: SEC-C domain-containing protein [Clostridia bacterium]|nr:SEC-C domain-containing protein [Clostridia bacterium]